VIKGEQALQDFSIGEAPWYSPGQARCLSSRPSIMIEGIRRARLSRRGESTLRLSRKCLFRHAKIESLSGLFIVSLKELLNGECFPGQGLGDP
jgi:hypothetical protein